MKRFALAFIAILLLCLVFAKAARAQPVELPASGVALMIQWLSARAEFAGATSQGIETYAAEIECFNATGDISPGVSLDCYLRPPPAFGRVLRRAARRMNVPTLNRLITAAVARIGVTGRLQGGGLGYVGYLVCEDATLLGNPAIRSSCSIDRPM